MKPSPDNVTEMQPIATSVAPKQVTIKNKKTRWFVRFFLFFIVASFCLLAWILSTTAGLRWAVNGVERLTLGTFHLEKIDGSVLGGLHLQHLTVDTKDIALSIDDIRIAIRPWALLRAEVVLPKVQVGVARLITKKTPPTPHQSPPDFIGIPWVSLVADSVEVTRFEMPNSGFWLADFKGRYAYQQAAHHVTVNAIELPWGRATGQASLGGDSPFLLTGKVSGSGVIEGYEMQATVGAAGSLTEMDLSAQVSAGKVQLRAKSHLRVFQPLVFNKLGNTSIQVSGFNPQTLLPSLPQALIDLSIESHGSNDTMVGGFAVVNHQAGAWFDNQIPASLITGEFSTSGKDMILKNTMLILPEGGSVGVAGDFNGETFDTRLQLKNIVPKLFAASAPKMPVSGTVRLSGEKWQPVFKAQLTTKQANLDAEVIWHRQEPTHFSLNSVVLKAGSGSLLATGTVDLEQAIYDLKGKLAQLNPHALHEKAPVGALNGTFDVVGDFAEKKAGRARVTFLPSVLSALPLVGNLEAAWSPTRLDNLLANLQVGQNRLQAQGAWGKKGDALNWVLNADNLANFGMGWAGQMKGKGQVSGTPIVPIFTLDLAAENLMLAGVKARTLKAEGQLSGASAAPFVLTVTGAGLQSGDVQLDTLSLIGKGTRLAHTLTLATPVLLNNKTYAANLALAGGWTAAGAWQGKINELSLLGAGGLRLNNTPSLTVQGQNVSVGAANLSALQGTVQWQQLAWQAGRGLTSTGSATGLDLTDWLPKTLKQNLIFGANWQLNGLSGGWPQGTFSVRREAGDVWLNSKQSSNIQAASVDGVLQNGMAKLSVLLNTQWAEAQGLVSVGLTGASPSLTGKLNARVADLSALRGFLSGGVAIAGAVNADLTLSGYVSKPLINGVVSGDKLMFLERKSGFRLDNGQLLASIAGQNLTLTRLSFGEADALTMQGGLSYASGSPEGRFVLTAKKFTPIDKKGRRITLSGSSLFEVSGGEAQKMALSGDFVVDRARLDMPKLGTATLGDDVQVVGRQQAEVETKIPFSMRMNLDLGDDTKFTGFGLETDLKGKIAILSEPNSPPTAEGKIYTDKGRFKAYGQDLDIAKGEVVFKGNISNPYLFIQALKRRSAVNSGVEISGYAQSKLDINLTASESLSERDKLGWLVLGRAPTDDAGDNLALAVAAGSALVGRVDDSISLTNKLGIDWGVNGVAEKNNLNGTVSPAEQVVSFGKQLSNELYLGYEVGITTSNQALKGIYQFNPSFSVILKAGTPYSSAEGRYTKRFD
jgi:translocation and assembly module TamB